MAALVVAIFHCGWTNPLGTLQFIKNGYLMVDFFFVLSGFVIFHSYAAKIATLRDVSRFMWLRFARLYPLHLCLLFIFVGIECVKWFAAHRYGLLASVPAFQASNLHAFVANLLLVQGLGVERTLTFNYPSWSISTEFYAYLLFASAVLWFRRPINLLCFSIFTAAASIALLINWGCSSLDDATAHHAFFRCCAGFFIGGVTYHLYGSARRYLRSSVPQRLLRASDVRGANPLRRVAEPGLRENP